MNRLQCSIAALALVLLAFAPTAQAATHPLVFGAGYASGSNATSTTAQAFTGTGSFFKDVPVLPVVEMYIDPLTQLGGTFNVSDIAAIRYHTLNDGTNPSGVDFFLKIYTQPYSGGDAVWYGNRLNAEPLYSNNHATVANSWAEWTTDAGTNQLTFFDANHGPLGFYNAPTLADLKAGPITWQDWDSSGDTTPIDYANQPVLYLVFGTGSGWSSFTGYLDAIEIELTSGEIYQIDLEDAVDEVWVDDDYAGAGVGTEVAPGLFMGHNAFDTVQDGVNWVSGSTVHVAAGTYVEQVEIDKDLNLLGDGMGSTIIQSPTSLPLYFTTSADNHPIIYVHDADTVAIHDLTVDGQGNGNANARFIGVGYRQAGGGVYDCEIKDVRNDPLDGGQHGNAFYLYNNDTVARSIDVQGCQVIGFQKNGITVNATDGTAITVDVSGNTVTGATALTYDNGDPAQNGIQIYGDLLTGAVNNNTIHSIAYDNTNNPTKYVASSILAYYTQADVTNNVIDGTHVGLYNYDGQGTISGNDMTIEKIGVSADGIIVVDPPNAVPSPFDLPGSVSAKSARSLKMATLGVVIDGNTIAFSGMDNTATYGVEADAGFVGTDNIDLVVTNNTITGFEAGVSVYQCESGCTSSTFTSVAINDNSFSGNTDGVWSNLDYLTVDATCNWWGDVSGPAATTPLNAGTGDAVEGDVTYWPWLDGDITGTPSCSVFPNTFAVEPPSGVEITPCAPCLTVPVVLHRSDSTPIRGFSITFELSSELQLCGSGIVPSYGTDSWVNGFSSGDVQDFVLDHGDGTYTVDRSILGSACGSDQEGDAFTVDVASTLGSASGTGTITILSVIVRDCDNGPLPGGSAGAATIDIDATAPDAVTSLSASQVKTGNGTNGTTKIHLAWTGPTDPDATTITLYRKGFGHYPEYDDDGGAVPSTPADPSAAAGDGWGIAATLPASATSYDDEPTNRDFWYYVAFVDDGCNLSPVSNQTGGTLNYHLGDVADGSPTPGAGDNSVATIDISALGGGYGTSEGNTYYSNYLDVGPTTDYSVDALPTTDNEIQFEDLMMFAINYGQVSKGTPALAAAAFNEITLKTVPFGDDGLSVEIHMAGDGTLQGVHVPLQWNANALRPVAMREGSLMAKQGRTAMVLSAKPGEVDAAVFGKGAGISGEALLAVIDFRRIGDGDPGITPGEIVARDELNHEQPINGTLVSGSANTALPSRTVLNANYPNPFNPKTTLSFTLAKAGHVSLRIYSIGGRSVATLASGEMSAGPHEIQWTGMDDHGKSVSSGTYLVRLVAPDVSTSQRITLLK